MIRLSFGQLLLTITAALLSTSAAAERFPLDDGVTVIGESRTTRTIYEDTLVDVARRHGLGYQEIRLANPGIDPWIPGEDTEVVLPTRFVLPRSRTDGVVINLAEYRMYFYSAGEDGPEVRTFPISIGKMDWGTPLGRSRIVRKVKNPSWYPPQSVKQEYEEDGRELPDVVPPGPDNPLGDYALRLSIPGYLIHGTNRPAGVGMRVTHGCIRMFPEDIEWLFPEVSVDTSVEIVNQPYKMGWLGEDLYLEVHPPLDEDEATRDRDMTVITELYVLATEDRTADVDWTLVDQVYRERLGMPVRIGRGLPRDLEPEAQGGEEVSVTAANLDE